MDAYAVKVGTATSFEAFLGSFPEAAQAAKHGVRVLAAPNEAPVLDFSKIRQAPGLAARRPGPKA